MRIWMHPYLPRRNLRIVIHRWGSLSCAWRPTDSELHRWPVDPTSGNVKLLLPPRQSRGNSHNGLEITFKNHIDELFVRSLLSKVRGSIQRQIPLGYVRSVCALSRLYRRAYIVVLMSSHTARTPRS